MKFYVMSLFPQMILDGLNTSITGRAIDSGVLSIEAVDIRDFSNNKHMKVDDYPYGGGAGMVMQPGPVCDAYESIAAKCSGRPRVVYMTPQGHTFNQHMAEEFAKEEELVILCGHYEGIDERALESIVTDYVSIGDYVLTGGELPAMVVIDSVSRLVPGVLNNDESAQTESFSDGLLEYPQYTRPANYKGMEVPEVLLSGHHGNIEKWRHEKSLERTKKYRPLALILKNKSYDGISYISTKNYGKDTELSGDDYKENIAIFTKLDSEHVYDRQLYDKIQLTVPIDISKIDIITKEDVEELLKEIEKLNLQEKINCSQKIYNTYNVISKEVSVDGEEYSETDYGKIHLYELYTVLNNILVE